MPVKLPMLLTLWAVGCAVHEKPPEYARVAPPSPTARAREQAPPLASEVLAEAERAFDSQLGALRGGHFDTEHQVSMLRQAVLLYTQFLERAEGRPELLPAVRKSRERIADANATIEFLMASLRAEDEAAPRGRE